MALRFQTHLRASGGEGGFVGREALPVRFVQPRSLCIILFSWTDDIPWQICLILKTQRNHKRTHEYVTSNMPIRTNQPTLPEKDLALVLLPQMRLGLLAACTLWPDNEHPPDPPLHRQTLLPVEKKWSSFFKLNGRREQRDTRTRPKSPETDKEGQSRDRQREQRETRPVESRWVHFRVFNFA